MNVEGRRTALSFPHCSANACMAHKQFFCPCSFGNAWQKKLSGFYGENKMEVGGGGCPVSMVRMKWKIFVHGWKK